MARIGIGNLDSLAKSYQVRSRDLYVPDENIPSGDVRDVLVDTMPEPELVPDTTLIFQGPNTAHDETGTTHSGGQEPLKKDVGNTAATILNTEFTPMNTTSYGWSYGLLALAAAVCANRVANGDSKNRIFSVFREVVAVGAVCWCFLTVYDTVFHSSAVSRFIVIALTGVLPLLLSSGRSTVKTLVSETVASVTSTVVALALSSLLKNLLPTLPEVGIAIIIVVCVATFRIISQRKIAKNFKDA